jgi:hypothetical protein
MIAPTLIAAFCLAAIPSVSTDWLLDRNEEALGRIHSFRATVESRVSYDGGIMWTPFNTLRLVRSGGRERIRLAMTAFPLDGVMEKEATFQEWLNTPEGTWDLSGLNLDHPPRESVSYIKHEATGKGPRVTGRISPPRKQGPYGYDGSPGPTALGFVVHGLHSLREMKQFSGTVTPVEGRDGHGDPTWILRLKPREGKSTYEVHLNSKYGYMISAYRVTGISELDWQVEEFQEPAPGVYLAKATRRTIKGGSHKKPLIVADTIAVADVNRPIPASDLGLDYPAGVLIGDDRDHSFNIWGDGKPALKFTTESEFLKWRMDQVVAAMKARRPWWREPAMIALMVGSALALITLLVYRRRLVGRGRALA